MNKLDDLGDRMKRYERAETDRRVMNFAPVIARMDGRGFSQWTAGLERPYDKRLSDVMIEVTKALVSETNARIGYTQSDEITLVFLVEDIKEMMMFDGKIQKLCSVLSSFTTARFIIECLKAGGELARRVEKTPHFDGRVFQVPTRSEAANAVLWREQDAAKNAVSMAARSFFSHQELQGKSGPEMQEMMFSKGQNFNDYPSFFKRGSFLRVQTVEEELPEQIRKMLPGKDPGLKTTCMRRRVTRMEMPVFSRVTNRVEVIFDGAEPTLYEPED